MKRLKLNKHFLHILKRTKAKDSKAILKIGGDSLIKAVIECVINTLNENIDTPKKTVSKLRRFEICLQKIADSAVPFKKKRELILNQKGGWLGILLSSILAGVVGRLLDR